MSALGDSINGGLVLLVVVAVVGTVGATFYYQQSVERLDDRTDALSNRTQTLERNLSATRSDLRAERERARELNRSLDAAESDVSALSTELKRSRNRSDAATSELVAKERRLDDAEAELAETRADLEAACDRLERLDAAGAPSGDPTATPADPWADEPWGDIFVGDAGDPDSDSDGTPTEQPWDGTESTAGGDPVAACEE